LHFRPGQSLFFSPANVRRRYTLQREAIPLDRQDFLRIKDSTNASLPSTNIATRIRVCDARFDHDALADGPISTFHSSSTVQIFFLIPQETDVFSVSHRQLITIKHLTCFVLLSHSGTS